MEDLTAGDPTRVQTAESQPSSRWHPGRTLRSRSLVSGAYPFGSRASGRACVSSITITGRNPLLARRPRSASMPASCGRGVVLVLETLPEPGGLVVGIAFLSRRPGRCYLQYTRYRPAVGPTEVSFDSLCLDFDQGRERLDCRRRYRGHLRRSLRGRQPRWWSHGKTPKRFLEARLIPSNGDNGTLVHPIRRIRSPSFHRRVPKTKHAHLPETARRHG